MNILLIAGHGDGDSGAVGNGYKECDLTREFASLICSKLKKICCATLADTNRNWFEYIGTNSYDFSDYNYVLEIHFNAGGGTGSEIYVTDSEKGITVEESILNNLCGTAGYNNRGVKRKNFRVIQRIKSQGISSALLEVCFIDSEMDIATYQQKKDLIARAIANGIAEGFGLTTPAPEAPDALGSSVEDNAIEWCTKNNLLHERTTLDSSKIWTCVLLYNTVKFMAENE